MVVTARLPSGAPVRVQVIGPESGDGMTSAGLRDLDLDNALDTVAEIGSVVVDKLKAFISAPLPFRDVDDRSLSLAFSHGVDHQGRGNWICMGNP